MSEDEFDDFEEFELNEDILKALQDTEDRYNLTSASQAAVTQFKPAAPVGTSTLAVTARPHTIVPRRSYIDLDDTPDISISVDGTYAIQPPAALRPNVASSSTMRQQTSQRANISHASSSSNIRLRANLSSGGPQFPPPQSSVRRGAGPTTTQRTTVVTDESVVRRGFRPTGSFNAPVQASVSSTDLDEEVQRLRAQIQQVSVISFTRSYPKLIANFLDAHCT